MRIVKIINFNNNLCSIIKKNQTIEYSIYSQFIKKNYMSKYLVFNILNIR